MKTMELRPARLSDRFIAYWVDTIPYAGASVLSVWIWGSLLNKPLSNTVLWIIGGTWILMATVAQLVGNLYGATPGKLLMGLQIITDNGVSPSTGQSFIRTLFWLLGTPLLNAGFLVALFHPQSRALHDLAAGTFVVESGPRRSNGMLACLATALILGGTVLMQYCIQIMTPTPQDISAIARAQNGLDVIAKIQDQYFKTNGVYASSVADLALASGNVELFRQAMLDVFSPTPFQLQAGNRKWRVTAAAKDRHHTLVYREGP